MATEYQVWISDVAGVRVALIPFDHIIRLSYSLKTNTFGSLNLTIPADAVPASAILGDARIELWSKPDGGGWRNVGDTFWLIQQHALGISTTMARYRTIEAVSVAHLLARRYVLYYANSAGALKTAAADDMMKAIVRENLGSSADGSPLIAFGYPTRLWSTYLTVAADLGLGPSLTRGFAWRNVLAVLQEIAKDVAQQGTPIYFDITASTDVSALTFQTWLNVRRVDRSTGDNALIVSPERRSLGGTIEITEDWSDVATAVVAGGQGEDASRVLGIAFNSTRIGLSPFGLRELFSNATSQSSGASLASESGATLQEKRPKRILTADLFSVPGAVYGVDWGHGDKLIAEFEDLSFAARVDAVTVNLDKGEEKIKAAIQGEL